MSNLHKLLRRYGAESPPQAGPIRRQRGKHRRRWHEPRRQGASVLRGEIVAALERMPLRYRRILFMRHFQHKDVNQIAEELHKPEGTVKSWLFRARAMLRKEMAVGFR